MRWPEPAFQWIAAIDLVFVLIFAGDLAVGLRRARDRWQFLRNRWCVTFSIASSNSVDRCVCVPTTNLRHSGKTIHSSMQRTGTRIRSASS